MSKFVGAPPVSNVEVEKKKSCPGRLVGKLNASALPSEVLSKLAVGFS